MNERIRELADHCWKDAFHYSPNGPETYTEFDYDKFAELIVAECCQQINSQCFPSNSREWCEKGAWNGYLVAQIREHFGVGE